MGNIEADFILQMHQAMRGIDDPVSKETHWDEVEDLGLRCLWPSRQTAQSMNFHSIINSLRAIPLWF
jgi:hypothetical protein